MNIHKPTLAVMMAFAGGASAQTVTLPEISVATPPVIEELRVDDFSSTSAEVTDEQLRDQNAVDLASALRHTPGVQIQRFNPVGAFGDEGAVYIRGMGSSRPGSEIKPYVDGIPFYNGVWDHPLLDLLPINGIQSITIHKSPQPQVNGNNFASINLQTRRATEEGVHGDARVSAGSFGTVVEQANLLGRHGDLDFMLAQGYAKSDGHRPDADGELKNIMGRVGLRLNDNWSVSANFIYADNKVGDPGDARVAAPADAPRYNTQAGMLSANVSHAHGDWRGSISIYANQGDIQWRNRPAPEGDTLTSFRMSGLRWKEQLSPWTDGTIVVGLDHDRIAGDVRFNRIAPAPRVRFDSSTLRITSPYVSVSQRIALERDWILVPSAGIRYYDHSQFKSEPSPHIGVSLVSERLTVFANVARGINYPGLEAPALSFVIPALGASWKHLSAERLDHVELGIKFSPSDATQIDVSIFDDRVKNRYIFGFPPEVPPPAQFLNLGAYRIKGAELAIRQVLGDDWVAFAGLTLLEPSDDNLPYTPKQALTAGINGQIGPVRVVLDALYQSQVWALNRARVAGAVNGDKVGSFAVANARLSYPLPGLGKKGEVFLAVENLFDRDYEYRPGYPMPGRWGQVGLSASY